MIEHSIHLKEYGRNDPKLAKLQNENNKFIPAQQGLHSLSTLELESRSFVFVLVWIWIFCSRKKMKKDSGFLHVSLVFFPGQMRL